MNSIMRPTFSLFIIILFLIIIFFLRLYNNIIGLMNNLITWVAQQENWRLGHRAGVGRKVTVDLPSSQAATNALNAFACGLQCLG